MYGRVVARVVAEELLQELLCEVGYVGNYLKLEVLKVVGVAGG